MDPDACLKEILELSWRFEDMTASEAEWHGHRLSGLIKSLDEWITKGGFLPARWQKPAGDETFGYRHPFIKTEGK